MYIKSAIYINCQLILLRCECVGINILVSDILVKRVG